MGCEPGGRREAAICAAGSSCGPLRRLPCLDCASGQRLDGRHRLTSGGQMHAAGLATAVRTLGQGVVARARALATSGPSSQSAPRTAMSACGPAEEVDEGVERHGADWQGIKEPYVSTRAHAEYGRDQPWGHHAIRMKDAFWPWMAASCWTIQMPIWGESSGRGGAEPWTLGAGHKKGGVTSLDLDLEAIRAF